MPIGRIEGERKDKDKGGNDFVNFVARSLARADADYETSPGNEAANVYSDQGS